MAQLNPMLVRLQQKIEDYNKDIQRKIDDVANRQKLITIGVRVAFYSGNVLSEVFVVRKEKAPNELGLYDMSGGVWELTSSHLSEVDFFIKMIGGDFGNNFVSRRGGFSPS